MYTNTIFFRPQPRIDLAPKHSDRSMRPNDDPYGFERIEQITSEFSNEESALDSIDAALNRYKKRISGNNHSSFASLQEIFRLKF